VFILTRSDEPARDTIPCQRVLNADWLVRDESMTV